MDNEQLLGLRGLALDDADPIRRVMAVELLVMEVHRLQHCSQCGAFQEENICLGCD